MSLGKSKEIGRIKTAIASAPSSHMVLVGREYARHFTKIPNDGRLYVVLDPRDHNVQHWTFPDGSYIRQDEKTKQPKGVKLLIRFNEKRTLYKDRKPIKKQIRVAEDVTTQKLVSRLSDETPEISLIDIQRVMRIVGFRKSFIYEQVDFPRPIRLGTSRRSAVRWVESEVLAWVKELTDKRSITNPTDPQTSRR